ncbi:MAG: VCBS repeat-containing protein [Anaerolineaceae bacterium]|nr:VCBS repeat-containing protein [Anaerolineaceae bacterium]
MFAKNRKKFIFLLSGLLVILISSCTQADNQSKSQDSVLLVEETEVSGEIPEFIKSEQSFGNTRTFGLEIADVDMDSDDDIFITNYIGESMLWLNDGKGTFTQSTQTFNISEGHDVGIADFYLDGFPDIFLLSHASPSKVYFGNESGEFIDSKQNIGSETDYPGMIVLGDVDSDGDMDAFISYYEIPNRLWLNDGNGFFEKTDTEFGVEGNPGYMELSDFNGDSFLDLFLCMSSAPDQVLLNDGNGNFINSGQALGSLTGNDAAESEDIDGDGDNDVIVTNNEEGIKVWLNQNNTGVFEESGEYFGENVSLAFILMDADSDGDFDLINAHQNTLVSLWLNDGKGSFTSAGTLTRAMRAGSFGSKDLDGDGDEDVVFGQIEGSGGTRVYFNN